MDEFAKALAQIQWPVPLIPCFRVYYDPETGQVLNYAMDDLPGTWIEVDRETFHAHRFDRRVKDGRLVAPRINISKLRPSANGTACDLTDITIIVDQASPHIKWSMYHDED